MSQLRFRLFLITLGAFAGWGSVLIVSTPGCGHQLTVQEADDAVTASCVLLARAMTDKTPELLDQAVAQACQPGRTRDSLDRLIAKLSRGAEGSGVRGPGSGSDQDPESRVQGPGSSSSDAGAH